MSIIRIIGPRDSIPKDGPVINTTSRSTNWSRGLSPFIVGPCELYDGYMSKNMENAWQYSKVYGCHVKDGEPTNAYWQWAQIGWNSSRAHRYPMGKGRKPKFALWGGEKLSYIEARKKIYIPLYSNAVAKTDAYQKLKEICNENEVVYLWDFDGYRHDDLNMSFKDVLNHPDKKMGHAFVLAVMLKRGV